ncbi:MAG: PD-(D/E)XK nuclease family transposase [Taibaiella sp.]|nr:PD-(D/E)XK nuclease family transposase [Taibaiella sp.]
MPAKYVNPFTDFGFKKLFGEEASKPALIDFLNSLLVPENSSKIVNIYFKNSERNGDTIIDRRSIYDIYCENDKGEKYIVELQKARQDYFKERTIFYSTFPIREQAEKGSWNYNLSAVFCVGILGFTFNDYKNNEAEKQKVVHTIKLKYDQCNVFYDKLTYLYIEVPNFKMAENELITRLDKWLYFIKHLEDFQSIPELFKGDVVFTDVIQRAEIANFNYEQMMHYEGSLKVFRDNINVVDSAEKKGREEGILIGAAEKEEYAGQKARQVQLAIAANCRKAGMSTGEIAKITGLTIEEINDL